MDEPRFYTDKTAYLVSNTWLAVMAMAGAMLILWLLGNPHIWTGAVAGLGGIVVRGWYLASEELNAEWVIKNHELHGPGGRTVPLNTISQMKPLGNFVQIITSRGDKHLIKYQADPKETIRAIERAAVTPVITDRTSRE
jgi:hypothetical protein